MHRAEVHLSKMRSQNPLPKTSDLSSVPSCLVPSVSIPLNQGEAEAVGSTFSRAESGSPRFRLRRGDRGVATI